MFNKAIVVNDLSKIYTRNKAQLHSSRLKFRSFFSKEKVENFYALQDISFEIAKGQALGIIGNNGAGKSTLLKLLSGISRPTSGQITIYGKVSSLLEVGTGFHPELSGRENVYLNGAILGMSKKDIAAQFDEIVEFSGLEAFIDTPVKHYSSGMYVRLAFSVASHLQNEIIILDEIMAVGDIAFQNKSTNKIKNLVHDGKTVLLVSHDIPLIKRYMDTGLLLINGRLDLMGTIDNVCDYYTDKILNQEQHFGKAIEFAKCSYENNRLTIEVKYNIEGSPIIPNLGLVIYSETFQSITGTNQIFENSTPSGKSFKSKGIIKCELNQLNFVNGKYFISLWLANGHENIETLNYCLAFHVSDSVNAIRNTGNLRIPAIFEID